MYCENCYHCHCIDWFTVLYNTDSEGRYCSCLVPKGRMNFICKLALEKKQMFIVYCLLFPNSNCVVAVVAGVVAVVAGVVSSCGNDSSCSSCR